MIHRAIALCMASTVLALAGCSSTRSPAVSVVNASAGERVGNATVVHLTLRLENPNAEPLELLEFDYQVNVDGRRAYSGKRAAQMTLARESVRETTIPAVITFEQPLPPTAQVSVSGTLKYLLPGTFAQTLFDIGVRRPRIGFHGSEQVTFGSPEAAAQAAAFSDSREPAAPSRQRN